MNGDQNRADKCTTGILDILAQMADGDRRITAASLWDMLELFLKLL